jgi:hypothetical protein
MFPKQVFLDPRAQLIMIGRQITNELGLTTQDMDPCPFTFATSLEGSESLSDLIKLPLQIQSMVGKDSHTTIAIKFWLEMLKPMMYCWDNKHYTQLDLDMIIGQKKLGFDLVGLLGSTPKS